MNNLKELLKKINIQGKICFNEPLACHTTFKIGGPADIFIEPANPEEFLLLYNFCLQNQVPWFILGEGANLLISDKGIRGLVISTKQLNTITIREHLITAGAGAAISDVAAEAANRGLSGLEFLYAMPGSVGGAIYMNARCYDKEMSDVLTAVDTISALGRVTGIIDKKDFGYKTSPFQDHNTFICNGMFRLTAGDPARSWAAMEAFKKDREAKGHFLYPSAGSVFKNNRAFGKPTGAILNSLGLKGLSVGAARVSEQHANIFINRGNARASDVYALMQLARDKTRAVYGYELEPELILAGEWEYL